MIEGKKTNEHVTQLTARRDAECYGWCTRSVTTAVPAQKAQRAASTDVVDPPFRQAHGSDKWRCVMKRLTKQIALATFVAFATLITAEAASARPLHQETFKADRAYDALYSRMIAPGG